MTLRVSFLPAAGRWIGLSTQLHLDPDTCLKLDVAQTIMGGIFMDMRKGGRHLYSLSNSRGCWMLICSWRHYWIKDSTRPHVMQHSMLLAPSQLPITTSLARKLPNIQRFACSRVNSTCFHDVFIQASDGRPRVCQHYKYMHEVQCLLLCLVLESASFGLMKGARKAHTARLHGRQGSAL